MRCVSCGFENPATALHCEQCNGELDAVTMPPQSDIDPDAGTKIHAGADIDPDPETIVAAVDNDATQVYVEDAATRAFSDPLGIGPVVGAVPTTELAEGGLLAGRYQIVRLLGRGGMGAVYQATDMELDRPVAIKLIRPEFAEEPEIIQRFKQELIMAREVTHPNVVRIFDLGSSEGFRFITMEFVAGRDLKSLIRDTDGLDAERATRVLVQTCRALQAAHDAGIVHRDLKPQNIMIDVEDTVKVMDFGIARSADITGMTRTGQMMGTPDYMSPEQAMAQPVDTRSDIFSLGIIAYEILSGELPYTADTPYGSLIKRTKEKAPALSGVREGLPPHLGDIVAKCLHIDPDLRYQSVADIAADLEGEVAPSQPSLIAQLPRQISKFSRSAKIGLAAALIATLGLAALVVSGGLQQGGTAPPDSEIAAPVVDPLSLAILPFRNATGNTDLDWLGASLPELLRTDVGQSAELLTVPSERVYQILGDLKIDPGSAFDPQTINRLGSFSNADVIVAGQYVAAGRQIRIDATLHDLRGQVEVSLTEQAQGEDDLLAAITRLAATIRDSMDLSAGAVSRLEASSFSPSTTSMEALRRFNEGLQSERASNFLDAAGEFEAAVAADPEFALAHARLAQTYKSLGRDNEAELASRTAQRLSADLPEYERLLIAANHAQILNNFDRAIEAYEQLAQAAPGDPQTNFELAQLYDEVGDFDNARQRVQSVLRNDPNYVDALYVAARVEIGSGNPRDALQPLDQALRITQQSGNEEARARVLNAIGVAYMDMNEPEDALAQYAEALQIRQQLDDRQGTADTLNNIGRIQAATGDLDAAFTSYGDALTIRREIGDRDGIAASLIDIGNLHGDRGEWDEALELFNESLRIQRELGNRLLEAQVLNNIGVAYYEVGDHSLALTHYEQALALRETAGVPADIAETLYNLGETSAALGEYDDAFDYYLQARDQARASGDDFLVAVTAQGLGVMHGFQGRFSAALEAHEEAFNLLQGLDAGFWLYTVTAGYGGALSDVGRFDDAAAQLDAARAVADQLGSRRLAAQTLLRQGRNAYYREDFTGARGLFEEARTAADEVEDGTLAAEARLQLARVDLAGGAAPVDALAELAPQAQRGASTYVAVEAALALAQAQIAAGDPAAARATLRPTLNTTERQQLLALGAQTNFLLGEADRTSGDLEAAGGHYSEAQRLFEQIRAEDGDGPFRRIDLGRMRDTAARYAGGS